MRYCHIFSILLFVGLTVPAATVCAENVRSLTDIDAGDGIDRDEANVIAREFFHRYVSTCGTVGDPVESDGVFEYPLFLGKKEKPHPEPMTVDQNNGQVAIKNFSTAVNYKDIETEPSLETIMNECLATGEEDHLPMERWLQRERDAFVPCPQTDYYVLTLDKEDFPPETTVLEPYEKYAYCKYGNPATLVAVFTTDPAAKTAACAEPSLAAVRTHQTYDLQSVPAEGNNTDGQEVFRFKLFSRHFAAVVYTTVYDVSRYEYWVDRSYEFLRSLEYSAVNCLCPAGCEDTPPSPAAVPEIQNSVKALKALTVQPGAEYPVDGYIVEIRDCPPCPPDAVCATCQGEYIILADTPQRTEDTSGELWVSTMMKGQRDFKKGVLYRFTLKADDESLPDWDKADFELMDLKEGDFPHDQTNTQ